jgi:hypothetical protein
MTQEKVEAELAYLRLAFYEACDRYGRVFEGKYGKLPANWTMSREEDEIVRAWGRLYDRVRDTEGGLAVLQEIECQRQEIDRLQREVDRLSGAVPRPPIPVKDDSP